VTRTLSIALYDRVQDGDYGAAGRLSLMLLGFSVMALVVIYIRSARRTVDGE
jgi:molybdate transport system permease protein